MRRAVDTREPDLMLEAQQLARQRQREHDDPPCCGVAGCDGECQDNDAQEDIFGYYFGDRP